jgi:hypothetical protein
LSCSGFGEAFRPAKHTEKPQVAASRLPSFQSQTRTGTVCRSLAEARPTPYPASGPHSPSKVGNARTPMRLPSFHVFRAVFKSCRVSFSRGKCHSALFPSAKMERENFFVPCPPQEECYSGNLSGRQTSPGPENLLVSSKPLGEFPDSALMSRTVQTHHRRRSCEPFKDIKKSRGRQRVNEANKCGRRALSGK